MKWTEIKILTTYEAAEAIGEILYNNGANGLVMQDISPTLSTITSTDWDYSDIPESEFPPEEVRLVAYLPTTDDIPYIVENIRESVDNLKGFDLDVGEATFTLTEVQEEDWANNWKQYFKPITVDRIIIRPEWEEIENTDDKIVIDIDPGMAFGTGTHATTTHCLKFLQKYAHDADKAYDVGTGSGILTIATKKLGVKEVMAFDNDERAVKIARQNVKINGLSKEVDIKVNDLLDGVEKEVDLIVANITAPILMRLIPTAAKLLTASGTFILSGIIVDRELDLQQRLVNANLVIVDRLIDGEWVSLVAKHGRQYD